MIISRSICQKKIEIKVISFKFDTNDALVDSLLQVGNFWPSFLPQRYYSLVWIEMWNLVLTWTKRNRVFVGSKPNYYIGISNFVEQFDYQFFHRHFKSNFKRGKRILCRYWKFILFRDWEYIFNIFQNQAWVELTIFYE